MKLKNAAPTLLFSALLLILASPFIMQINVFYNFKFNIIKDMLESIEGVKVVDSWRHEDVALEDFGFTLQTANGSKTSIDFYESNNWFKVFYKADGIVIDNANHNQKVTISSQQLLEHKIKASNLKESVHSINQVVTLAKNKSSDSNSANTENYIHIRQ